LGGKFRVLIVEDFEPFRRLLSSELQESSDVQVIGEAADGLEAIQKAEELQPELILLDIGLPKLDGIETAQRIRHLSPKSKILFVTNESSKDFVDKAFRLGAWAYVYKTDVGRELLAAVNAVRRGERFVSSRFAGHDLCRIPEDVQTPKGVHEHAGVPTPKLPGGPFTHRHEAVFYSGDAALLEDFTQFVGTTLKAGNSVILVATELHRDRLLPKLYAHGVDMGSAIEQGRYIALDAHETLSTFMVDGLPDPVRFSQVVGDLILTAAKCAKAEPPRVAACGECAPLLLAKGEVEAAIRLEKLWDEIATIHDLDILCGYPLGSFQGVESSFGLHRISAVHSGVYLR
jgi:DNA-binding NarL/FixJ family response regulator